MKNFLRFLLTLVATAVFPLVCLAAIDIKLSGSDNLTLDPRVKATTVEYSLSAKPGNAVTVRAALSGSITGASITEGAAVVIQPNEYQSTRTVKISFSNGIPEGQSATLTLSGSGINTKAVNINKPSAADVGTVDAEDLPGSSLDINQLFGRAINLFLMAIAVAAFFSIIYSGFQYMSSAGDASKVEKARKNILWAVIALVLATLSFIFVRMAANLTT